MNKPVEDRDTGEMRVKPKTSLNLTLDFGVPGQSMSLGAEEHPPARIWTRRRSLIIQFE